MAKKKPATKPGRPNPWPARLKALRRRFDLTQAEAAARIDAPLSTWRGWEHGRRTPSPMIARLIALAFPEKRK